MKKILIFLTACIIISSLGYAETREAQAKDLITKIAEYHKKMSLKIESSKTDKEAAENILAAYTELSKLNIQIADFNIANADYKIDDKNTALKDEFAKSQDAMFDFSWAVADAQKKYNNSENVKKAVEEGYKIMTSPDYLAKLATADIPADKRQLPVNKNYDLNSPDGQIVKLMNELTNSLEIVTMKLKKSETDKDAVDALMVYTSECKKLSSKLKTLEAKYPDFSFSDINKDFEQENKRMEEAVCKLAEIMIVITEKYSDSEYFKKAIDDMSSSAESIE